MSEGMSIPGRVAYQLGSVKVLIDAGVIRPMRPDRLLRFVQTLVRWGRSPAAGAIGLADRFPNETMIVDELGALSFSEVHTRTNALASSLSDLGIVEGDGGRFFGGRPGATHVVRRSAAAAHRPVAHPLATTARRHRRSPGGAARQR